MIEKTGSQRRTHELARQQALLKAHRLRFSGAGAFCFLATSSRAVVADVLHVHPAMICLSHDPIVLLHNPIVLSHNPD